MGVKEDKIRSAELKVIEAARSHFSGQIEEYGHKVTSAIAELDALKSPLPSREELREECPGVSVAQMEYAGVYWLRWAANRRDILTDSVDEYELRKWADELGGRK